MRRRLVGRTIVAAGCLAACLLAQAAQADDVRYFEEGGVTYRETRQVIRHPVTEVTHQPTTRTVYREQVRSQLEETYRTFYLPVTEYRRESSWRGRWNPFVQPYLAEQWVPYTRWELRTEKVQTPVTRRELVPETRTEHVPVVTQRFVDQHVTSRVAVSGPSGKDPFTSQGTAVASRVAVGGVSRLDTPPRHGADDNWRPAQTTTLR